MNDSFWRHLRGVAEMVEGFTRMPNAFVDDVMADLTPVQAVVMVAIYRMTVGYGREEVETTLRELREISGIKKDETLINSLQALEKIKLIKRAVKRGGNRGGKTLISLLPFSGKRRAGHSVERSTGHSGKRRTEEKAFSVKWSTGHSVERRTEHYKENLKEKEREKGRGNENRFPFLEELDEAEFSSVVEKYLANVSREAKRPSAYRAKVRKSIEGGDLDSLKELEIFYRVKSLQDLTESYRHRSLGEEQVVDIYTAAEADQIEGHDPKHKWFVRFRSHARRVDRIVGYRSRRELEAAVRSALAAALADSSAGDAA